MNLFYFLLWNNNDDDDVQCDQIGQFFKFLCNKFALKISPKILLTFALLWKQSINIKTAVDIIQATFENIWATF